VRVGERRRHDARMSGAEVLTPPEHDQVDVLLATIARFRWSNGHVVHPSEEARACESES
jgi:hypothetical protein